MNVQSGSAANKDRPLVAFEEQLNRLCGEDKYAEMAEAFSSFVKAYPGIHYLAFEPVPYEVSTHLVEKTQTPSAFMTLTLRKPTWRDEMEKALSDPSAFQTYVTSLEKEVLEIAKQTKKLS